MQLTDSLQSSVYVPVTLRYWFHCPDDATNSAPAPLLFFLHGAGERGHDVDGVTRHGPPMLARRRPDFPFAVLAPQCEPGSTWDNHLPHALLALLDAAQSRYDVDLTRTYLSGVSMGGFGTWHLAAAAPGRFAAIAPICGGGPILKGHRLAPLPAWAFHGSEDTVVPPRLSRRMIEDIRDAGGSEAHLTEFPGVGHDSWTPAYGDPTLYTWLLAHRLSDGQRHTATCPPELAAAVEVSLRA